MSEEHNLKIMIAQGFAEAVGKLYATHPTETLLEVIQYLSKPPVTVTAEYLLDFAFKELSCR